MQKVKAKKFLGQHFLKDESVAEEIALTINNNSSFKKIVEIGPGMGVLTKYLIQHFPSQEIITVELDRESVAYLNSHYPNIPVINEDFLRLDITTLSSEPFALIGNYPYNISSQIVFKTIENRDLIPIMTGMFQKEVAERICSSHGSKVYGITSVLTQAFYKAEYLFTVDENVFNPPPKVKSGVLRLTRLSEDPKCDVKILFQVVKQAFNQRRKTLRNSLKPLFDQEQLADEIFSLRPEQLPVEKFIELANRVKQ